MLAKAWSVLGRNCAPPSAKQRTDFAPPKRLYRRGLPTSAESRVRRCAEVVGAFARRWRADFGGLKMLIRLEGAHSFYVSIFGEVEHLRHSFGRQQLSPHGGRLAVWRGYFWIARCETTEFHIYNVFVLIEVDIGAALQNQQPLRKTRALLVRCGEGSFSRGCRRVTFGPTPCRCRDQQATAVLSLRRYNPPSKRR